MAALEIAAWAWTMTSWCMCCYIAMASREGVRWFRPAKNPFLLISAAVGVAALLGGRAPPRMAAYVSGGAWSLYAALVARQNRRQLAGHVLPVAAPLLIIAGVLFFAAEE
jgi:hypothetical protein